MFKHKFCPIFLIYFQIGNHPKNNGIREYYCYITLCYRLTSGMLHAFEIWFFDPWEYLAYGGSDLKFIAIEILC